MRVTTAVLDHVAIGTRALADGLQLFGGVLGGEWAYGGEGGFRWGQLLFPGGPKIELITPMQDPGSAFLERFLSDRGPGPHHLNFIVPDIAVTLGRVRAAGIEPESNQASITGSPRRAVPTTVAPFLAFSWLIAAFVLHVLISNNLAHQDCGFGLSPDPWVTLPNGYVLGSHNTYDGYIALGDQVKSGHT